jgi:hypothetical protein
MRKNKIFQTIVKTIPGGVIAGLIKRYQALLIDLYVKIFPINPTR